MIIPILVVLVLLCWFIGYMSEKRAYIYGKEEEAKVFKEGKYLIQFPIAGVGVILLLDMSYIFEKEIMDFVLLEVIIATVYLPCVIAIITMLVVYIYRCMKFLNQ